MKKQDFMKLVQNNASEKGIELSLDVVKELLDVIETSIETVIVAEDTVNVMGLSFKSVDKPETSGTTQLGGNETHWTKAAHKAGKVGFTPSKKKSLERY